MNPTNDTATFIETLSPAEKDRVIHYVAHFHPDAMDPALDEIQYLRDSDAKALFAAAEIIRPGRPLMGDRMPPMWVVWLDDPSGKYGDHKAFFAYGETAQEAEQVAIKSRPGSSIKHLTTLPRAAGPITTTQ